LSQETNFHCFKDCLWLSVTWLMMEAETVSKMEVQSTVTWLVVRTSMYICKLLLLLICWRIFMLFGLGISYWTSIQVFLLPYSFHCYKMLQYLLHAFNVCMCTSLDTVLLFEEEKHVLLRVTFKRYTLCC
jgi:hypothetical protein